MQRNDSEPLFGDDVYQLLRDDSLLQRTGSTNFASLLESSAPLPELEQEQAQQPQQQPQQQLQQQQQQQQPQPRQGALQEVAYQQQNSQLIVVNNLLPGEIFQNVQVQQQNIQQTGQQIQQHQLTWDSLGIEGVEVIPSGNVTMGGDADIAKIEGSTTSCLADTTLTHSVPSLQPWLGRHKFEISLPTGNRDRNKWCFSEGLGKLYLCPNVAVPVNVMLQEWVNASITITPVFKQSCHRTEPVNRCFNCKNTQNHDPGVVEHIVQVEGEGCEYNLISDRYMVTVPLRSPPPGEMASTLLIKIMCLTSCVGGPNRRPFCLVFTLRNSVTGEEIGRQILDIKCCKCPSRDLTNDEKSMTTPSAPTVDEEKRTKVRKLATELAVGQKRKRPKIKVEPGTDSRMVNIAVPVEYEAQVKSYINKLIAADLIKKWQPDALMYPEEESS